MRPLPELTLNLASVREKNEEDDRVLVRNLQTKYEEKMRSNRVSRIVIVAHLCSAKYVESEKPFVNHLNSAPSMDVIFLGG